MINLELKSFKEFLNESNGNTLLTYNGYKVFMNTNNALNTKSHVQDRLIDRSNLDLKTFKEKFKKVIEQITENGIYVTELQLSKIQVIFSVKNKKIVIFTILDSKMKPKDYNYKLTLSENIILSLLDDTLNENEFDMVKINFEDVICISKDDKLNYVFENVNFLLVD